MTVSFAITDQLDAGQRRSWLDYWHTAPHAHPRQHPALASVECDLGRDVFFVTGTDGPHLVCAGAFSIRKSGGPLRVPLEAVSLRGPVFDDLEVGRQCLEAVLEHGRKLGIGRVRVAPYWTYPEAHGVETMFHDAGFAPCGGPAAGRQHTGYVALARDEDAIYAGFSKSFKKQIRAARQKQVRIESVTESADAERFYALYRAMQSRRGLPVIDPAEFIALFTRVFSRQDIGVALHAVLDDELLGGLYLMRTPSMVFPAQYALAERDGRGRLPASVSIGPMLWWHAIQWGRDAGCRGLDVEGYRPPEQESDRLRNVCAFKERMRPTHVTIINQHSRPCHVLGNATLRGLNFATKLAGEARRRYAALRAA